MKINTGDIVWYLHRGDNPKVTNYGKVVFVGEKQITVIHTGQRGQRQNLDRAAFGFAFFVGADEARTALRLAIEANRK